jgi:hypothetical protein
MSAKPTQHAWSSEALFNKALLYVGEMERKTATDWQFGLWSGLSLEFVARAALAHISPTLLACHKDWRNIHYALGHAPTAKRFTPISIPINEVLKILGELLPDFAKELVDFCVSHCARRNAELHSGEEAFAGLGTSAWLPKYYGSCDVLLQSMGKSLDDLFEDPNTAKTMVASLQDMAAKAVGKDIAVHGEIWQKMEPEEQKASVERAAATSSRSAGHRTKCPACGSPALIRGSGHGAVTTEVDDDVIVQKQMMLPSSFECVACGLKIFGLSKLNASDLGDAFTSTTRLSAAAFFDLHTEEELEEARAEAEAVIEEDFNE